MVESFIDGYVTVSSVNIEYIIPTLGDQLVLLSLLHVIMHAHVCPPDLAIIYQDLYHDLY